MKRLIVLLCILLLIGVSSCGDYDVSDNNSDIATSSGIEYVEDDETIDDIDDLVETYGKGIDNDNENVLSGEIEPSIFEEEILAITPESTEDEVLDFWGKAHIIRSEFANMNVYYSDTISVDGKTYYKVADKRFETYETFEDTFSPYFTERYTHEFMENDSRIVFTEDGLTYADGGAMGSNIYHGWSSLKSISFGKETANLVIRSEILDDNREVVDYEDTAYILVLEDGIWKFDTFKLTNFHDSM